jgi:hypothetical protein
MPGSPLIFAAVEGIVDEAVARRLIREAGGIPGTVWNGRVSGRDELRGGEQLSAWFCDPAPSFVYRFFT